MKHHWKLKKTEKQVVIIVAEQNKTNKAKVEFGTRVQPGNCFAEHKVLFHCGKDVIYNLQDEIQNHCKEV